MQVRRSLLGIACWTCPSPAHRLHRRPAAGPRPGRRRGLVRPSPFQGARPARLEQPDLTPVTDADKAVERASAARCHAFGPARRHRRGAGHDRAQPAPVDRRPHRRHQELRARGAGLGDPHRARRRRRGGAGRGLRTAAAAPVVGLGGQRRLDGPLAAQGHQVRGERRTPSRGRVAELLVPVRLGRRHRLDDFVSPVAPLLAHPRLRGLLLVYMLLAEGAVDIAAEPELEVYDMAALDVIVREAGGRFTSLDGTDGPWGAATRSPRTATCTTPHCPSSPRWTTTAPTPTCRAVGRARSAACAPGRPLRCSTEAGRSPLSLTVRLGYGDFSPVLRKREAAP